VPDEISAAANEHAHRVREMFATIAARYDLLNHLLSANVDKRWRRRTAQAVVTMLPQSGSRVLDIACGTGDLSLALFEISGADVVGTDFCRPMLQIATRKAADVGSIPFVEADALKLPFTGNSFDGAAIAFGLRNFADTEQGLREMLRVLRPNGVLAILECSRPVIPGLRLLFQFYFNRLLPLIGGLISGSRLAYEYLPNSVSRFLNQEELAALMQQVGFTNVSYQNLTGGIAALHLGVKSAENL
jgi:demethylmenaquinone methyltransferase / 2-methoxy-6-polyprenyl-1,4-benzoquinol methylase